MNPPKSTSVAEDSFENRLRNTPQRPAPIEWREQILTSATTAQRFQAASISRLAPGNRAIGSLWDFLARRIPVGWLGFTTVWVLIFASGAFDSWLNGTPSRSKISSTIPLRVVDFGKYRNELLRVAELLPETGPEERTPPPPHTPPAMRPHSRRDKLPQPFGGSASAFEIVPAAVLVLRVGQVSTLPLLAMKHSGGAERRQTVAHGVSRGNRRAQHMSPGGATEKLARIVVSSRSVAPDGARHFSERNPTACAVGYDLPLLRSFAKRR